MRLPAIAVAMSLVTSTPAFADDNWDATMAAARGQTVYWNAWGGDERTNAFIAWVGAEVKERFDVTIKQVKLSDTAEAVTRVLAEKAAGKQSEGSVDLIWINGPNFLSMKEQDLLFGPFVEQLPNAEYLDLSAGAAAAVDFTVPVEGFESPWRLAQFVFNHDSARAPQPPRSIAEFPAWAELNPGRFTHPDVSNFLGATFLKQALIELVPDSAMLQQPATDEAFDTATAPLWAWYDALKPHLWRGGNDFPPNGSVQQQLLNDGEIDISLSFDPASAAAAIEQGLLPDTVRTYTLSGGTIGNVSFVAIPFNSSNTEGAMVIANFLLEPEVQARAQDIRVLGSFSVLDQSRLTPDQRAAFAALPKAPALPDSDELGRTLLEPHPSWMTKITQAWAARYTR